MGDPQGNTLYRDSPRDSALLLLGYVKIGMVNSYHYGVSEHSHVKTLFIFI
jgi:hypothetical protein